MTDSTTTAHTRPTILVFDSGLGGLTVYREVVRLRPDARYVYAADDAFFPYGSRPPEKLSERVMSVMGGLMAEYEPDLVVIACNTASTVVLPELRAAFDVPFVGTVPAIKPACATTKTGLVSVLGTTSTVEREYTKTLIRDFGEGCEVTLVGSARLAAMAESELRGEPETDEAIEAEIAPCFVESEGVRTDVVVLACTHFPLLLSRFEKLAPWPVQWLDPAEAIARRVVGLLGEASGPANGEGTRVIFTSGKSPTGELEASLRGYGV